MRLGVQKWTSPNLRLVPFFRAMHATVMHRGPILLRLAFSNLWYRGVLFTLFNHSAAGFPGVVVFSPHRASFSCKTHGDSGEDRGGGWLENLGDGICCVRDKKRYQVCIYNIYLELLKEQFPNSLKSKKEKTIIDGNNANLQKENTNFGSTSLWLLASHYLALINSMVNSKCANSRPFQPVDSHQNYHVQYHSSPAVH